MSHDFTYRVPCDATGESTRALVTRWAHSPGGAHMAARLLLVPALTPCGRGLPGADSRHASSYHVYKAVRRKVSTPRSTARSPAWACDAGIASG